MTRSEKQAVEEAVEQLTGWTRPYWENDAATMWQGSLAWTSVYWEDAYPISSQESKFLEEALIDELGVRYEFQVDGQSGTIMIAEL